MPFSPRNLEISFISKAFIHFHAGFRFIIDFRWGLLFCYKDHTCGSTKVLSTRLPKSRTFTKKKILKRNIFVDR
jgi:hypothetical protein